MSRTEQKPTIEPKQPLRWREVLASVLLALIALWAVLTYLLPSWRICREHVLDSGAVVNSCAPVGVDDLPVIGLVLLIALLLLPNVAELGLPGGISIKR